MKAHTPLNRRNIIIQIKQDRDDTCQAVVPIHPAVFGLPEGMRTDYRIAQEALERSRLQFEEDTAGYVERLAAYKAAPDPSLMLDKYMRFNDAWEFCFSPHRGLARMEWNHGEGRPYEMYEVDPVVIENGIIVKKNSQEQATIEEIELSPNVAILYGSARNSDFVLLSREEMLEYEKPNALSEFVRSENGWYVVAPMAALCSSYTTNVPQAILFRNWAVEYHNSLLSMAAGK